MDVLGNEADLSLAGPFLVYGLANLDIYLETITAPIWLDTYVSSLHYHNKPGHRGSHFLIHLTSVEPATAESHHSDISQIPEVAIQRRNPAASGRGIVCQTVEFFQQPY